MYLKELNQLTYPLPLEIIDLYKYIFFLLAGLSQRYAGLTSEPQRHDLMKLQAKLVSANWKDISIQPGLILK